MYLYVVKIIIRLAELKSWKYLTIRNYFRRQVAFVNPLERFVNLYAITKLWISVCHQVQPMCDVTSPETDWLGACSPLSFCTQVPNTCLRTNQTPCSKCPEIDWQIKKKFSVFGDFHVHEIKGQLSRCFWVVSLWTPSLFAFFSYMSVYLISKK